LEEPYGYVHSFENYNVEAKLLTLRKPHTKLLAKLKHYQPIPFVVYILVFNLVITCTESKQWIYNSSGNPALNL